MKKFSFMLVILMLLLAGCSGRSRLTTLSPDCRQAGTHKTDSLRFTDSAAVHLFTVYLPPCYAENTHSAYPVLYWTDGYGQPLYDASDRLIHQGATPPFIIVEIDIDPVKGAGADVQIDQTVIPYIDSHYRTLAERRYRSITGISHGAAIAIRAAFRAPNLIGRVAVLSGGIADGEQEKFTAWIAAMPSGQRPAVLIDVGDQDGILLLTHYLTALLDSLHYPYTFTHAPGNHNGVYWDSRLEAYLKWLVPLDLIQASP
jgi:enterochelin esterase-like enzyme